MKQKRLCCTLIPFFLYGFVSGSPAQGLADPPRTPVVAITNHTGTYNEETIEYTATVSETFIAGPDGTPAGIMVNTAYVRDDTKGSKERPIMFVFNGGPGASSSPLHMQAFGPRVRRGETIVDNSHSPINSVDLVFIDPIGTGFSRPLTGIDGQPFWSVSGDAASIATFIESWLKINRREESPRFLCGESYGTVRAGQIICDGQAKGGLTFDGVLLFSLVGIPDGEEITFINTFPTFAVTAAFHGVTDPAGRSVGKIFEDASAFARTEYVSAMIQGNALPARDKERIARDMSHWIGLPADFVAEKNLRIDKSDFMLNLLRERGLRTGQLDARATGELSLYADRQPPFDDPSMSRPATPARIESPTSTNSEKGEKPSQNLIQTYMTEELKFPATETYRSLNLDINAKWVFDIEGAMDNTARRIGEVMQEQKNLRVFWAAGYYDLATPLAAGKYTLDHAGIPLKRLTVSLFQTGHSVFDGDENLARFTDAVRSFVQGDPDPDASHREE